MDQGGLRVRPEGGSDARASSRRSWTASIPARHSASSSPSVSGRAETECGPFAARRAQSDYPLGDQHPAAVGGGRQRRYAECAPCPRRPSPPGHERADMRPRPPPRTGAGSSTACAGTSASCGGAVTGSGGSRFDGLADAAGRSEGVQAEDAGRVGQPRPAGFDPGRDVVRGVSVVDQAGPDEPAVGRATGGRGPDDDDVVCSQAPGQPVMRTWAICARDERSWSSWAAWSRAGVFAVPRQTVTVQRAAPAFAGAALRLRRLTGRPRCGRGARRRRPAGAGRSGPR